MPSRQINEKIELVARPGLPSKDFMPPDQGVHGTLGQLEQMRRGSTSVAQGLGEGLGKLRQQPFDKVERQFGSHVEVGKEEVVLISVASLQSLRKELYHQVLRLTVPSFTRVCSLTQSQSLGLLTSKDRC